MSIDLGNAPVGTPPTSDEIEQIQSVLLLGAVEDVALSTWTGSTNISSVGPITITSSQVSNFESSVNALIPQTNVSLLSANWQSSYTTVTSNSATWGGGSDDTLASTKVRASSANWDSTYTTVASNSATWGSGSDDLQASTKVRTFSANWDSTYTVVRANSASWSNGGSVSLSAVSENILPDVDSTRNIGSDTFRWANGYFDNIDLLTLNVEAFGLLDTNQSHTLNLVYGEDASQNNTLTITTGNGNSAADYTNPGVNALRVWDNSSSRVESTPLPAGYSYDNTNLRPGVFTEKLSASHALTDLECYGSVYYITAAGVTITLPAIASGMSLTVICTTANVGIVDCNASDKIYLDGVALDDGDSVDSPGAIGDTIVFTYYDSTGWWATSNDWVDGGPS